MTVSKQELLHGRGSKKHFGRKMNFQFRIWRELASAVKICNKSVSRVIVDHKLNQLTMTCHCKKVSWSQQYSESTLKKCGYPTKCCWTVTSCGPHARKNADNLETARRFGKYIYWERNNAKKFRKCDLEGKAEGISLGFANKWNFYLKHGNRLHTV